MKRGRDAAELERVYAEHLDAVYAFFAYSVDAATAEDLAAATFERVIRAWKRYDASKAGERTWILSIARNLLTDHYRRGKHRQAVSLDEHAGLLDVVAVDDGDWEQRTLDQAELRSWLAVLGEREREVVALRYAGDLSAEEIATLLGLSAANVHQIVSRTLRKLREANR